MGTKIIVVSLLLVLNISISFAQKLPVKQNTSVIAPVGVKVDGKITEWGDLKA